MESCVLTHLVLTAEIGSPFCVSNQDGLIIHDRIVDVISRSEQVVLSFAGVTRLTTAFLNAAIGQLYDEFDESDINRLVTFSDVDQSQRNKISATQKNAKEFFRIQNTGVSNL